VLAAFAGPGPAAAADPDLSLYSGGFFSSQDRTWMDRIGRTRPEALAGLKPVFQDPRLDELFFRYRARNWPETLSAPEQARWAAHCQARLAAPPGKSLRSRAAFGALLADCRARQPERAELWQELEDYERQTRFPDGLPS
jgi:exodeoxyribonuclease-1